MLGNEIKLPVFIILTAVLLIVIIAAIWLISANTGSEGDEASAEDTEIVIDSSAYYSGEDPEGEGASAFDEFEAGAAKKHLRPVVKEAIEGLRDKLNALTDWSTEAIHQAINDTAEQFFEGKMGKIGMPLRVAVTGGGISPSIDVTMALIGKDRCLQGIDKALKYIEERAAS